MRLVSPRDATSFAVSGVTMLALGLLVFDAWWAVVPCLLLGVISLVLAIVALRMRAREGRA